METVYRYRKHLREPLKFVGIIILMFILFYSLFAFTVAQGQGFDEGVLLFFIIVGIIIFFVIGGELLLLYFLFLRRFTKISVRLTKDAIVYDNIKGRTVVPYEDVVELRFPSIKYTGGWVQIVHTKGDIKLTVVLESIGDFIKELKEKLDQRNMGHKYKKSNLLSFYKTAKYSDQSWERVYEYFKWILLFMGISGLTSVITTLVKGPDGSGILLLLASLIVPAICFIISEVIIGRRLAKGTIETSLVSPERDKSLEVKVYKWVFGVYFLLFICALVFI